MIWLCVLSYKKELRCQVSAQPPAKKTAGQIEKETDERSMFDVQSVRCLIQTIEPDSIIIKNPCHFGEVSYKCSRLPLNL